MADAVVFSGHSFTPLVQCARAHVRRGRERALLGARDSVVPQGCFRLSRGARECARLSYKRSVHAHERILQSSSSGQSLLPLACTGTIATANSGTGLPPAQQQSRTAAIVSGHGRSCIEQRLTSSESTPFPVPLYTCGHLNGPVALRYVHRALVIRGLPPSVQAAERQTQKHFRAPRRHRVLVRALGGSVNLRHQI